MFSATPKIEQDSGVPVVSSGVQVLGSSQHPGITVLPGKRFTKNVYRKSLTFCIQEIYMRTSIMSFDWFSLTIAVM